MNEVPENYEITGRLDSLMESYAVLGKKNGGEPFIGWKAETDEEKQRILELLSHTLRVSVHSHALGVSAQQLIDKTPEEEKELLSDGYHTFKQLYNFRLLYNANLFNMWDKYRDDITISKSFKHSDGKYCFDKEGEWFIVVAETPVGQISNHYHKDYWDHFQCKEVELSPEWDGHSAEDVEERLLKLCKPA